MISWKVYKKSYSSNAPFQIKKAISNLMDFRNWSLAVGHLNKKVQEELNRKEWDKFSGQVTKNIEDRLFLLDCDEVHQITRRI